MNAQRLNRLAKVAVGPTRSQGMSSFTHVRGNIAQNRKLADELWKYSPALFVYFYRYQYQRFLHEDATVPSVVKWIKGIVNAKPAGWRFFLRAKIKLVHLIKAKPAWDFAAAIGSVNDQSHFLDHVLTSAFTRQPERLPIAMTYGRLAMEEIRRVQPPFQYRLLLNQIEEIGDFVRNVAPPAKLQENQKNWQWFCHATSRWHDTIFDRQNEKARQARIERATVTWTSDVAEYDVTIEGTTYKVVPLTSGAMLDEEGDAMRHCVGSYHYKCAQTVPPPLDPLRLTFVTSGVSLSRLFSIRTNGRRLATLELIVHLDDYHIKDVRIGQLRGKYNAPVSVEVQSIAEATRAKYAFAHLPKDDLRYWGL